MRSRGSCDFDVKSDAISVCVKPFIASALSKILSISCADVSFDFSKANQKFQADQHVLIYEINGPFFFGAADKFIDSINQIGEKNKLIILGLKHVPFMDGTALHGFRRLVHTCYKHHIEVYITGINKQPLEVLQKAGLVDEIGKNHFYKTIEEAKLHYNQLKNS